jgi:hypothetical protein
VDGIKEMLDRLSELDEGQLSDLESKIIDEFTSVEKQEPTAQVVDSMTALADALDAVRGEQTSRVAAQQDLEKRAAEAAARVKPQDDPNADPNADPAADPNAPTDAAPPDDAAPTDVPPDAAPTDVPPDVPTDAAPPDAPPVGDGIPVDQETETPAEDASPDEEEEKKKQVAPAGTFEATEVPAGESIVAEPASTESVPEPAIEPTAEVTSEAPPAEVSAEPVAVSTTPPAQNEEIPVAASATDVVVTPPAENRPVPRQSASVAITAGADIPGISAGTELTTMGQVTDAFMTPRATGRRSRR